MILQYIIYCVYWHAKVDSQPCNIVKYMNNFVLIFYELSFFIECRNNWWSISIFNHVAEKAWRCKCNAYLCRFDGGQPARRMASGHRCPYRVQAGAQESERTVHQVHSTVHSLPSESLHKVSSSSDVLPKKRVHAPSTVIFRDGDILGINNLFQVKALHVLILQNFNK